MRSSSIGTTTTQPLTYSLDNLSIFYTYPYTVENCDNLADGYRFGFNGKEKESDIYGESNAYDFGARIHDTRIGRWLSVDPLQHKYVSLTPYHFVGNSPISFKDPDGKVIQVAGKYQAAFMNNLTEAFGAKARTDFSFNTDGVLQFNGTKENYTKAEQEVLQPLIQLIDKSYTAHIIYEKTFKNPITTTDDKGTPVVLSNTDETGGEATIYTTPDSDVDIYIDPSKEAGFKEYYTVDLFYAKEGGTTDIKNDAIKNENNSPIKAGKEDREREVQLSTYSRLFHAIGHALGKKEDKEIAMTVENAAGAAHKNVGYNKNNDIKKVKDAPIKARDTDNYHKNHKH
jgi:RHS repeat-associated protein